MTPQIPQIMKNLFYEKLRENKYIVSFISNFMSIKSEIGNGVGSGKLFERLFVHFINKCTPFSAVHMNLMNSFWIWDIIISSHDISHIADELKEICRKNYPDVEQRITNLIGDDWIAISLKTYKDDACQITTDYSYREFLDEKLNGKSTEETDEFFNMLNKHDSNRYLIIALNTNDKKNEFFFRELSFNKKFEKIEFRQNVKLSQYNLILHGTPLFKVLYGKNQANAFQRGIWTSGKRSLNYFDLILKGKYEINDYFEKAILTTIV